MLEIKKEMASIIEVSNISRYMISDVMSRILTGTEVMMRTAAKKPE